MTVRDRAGDPIDPDQLTGRENHCWRGWLSRPDAAESIPCLACKPWLIPPTRKPTPAELAEFARRHPARRRP